MAQNREIPMLFSTNMVQALLAGTKTETRRTGGLKEINENPDEWGFYRVRDIYEDYRNNDKEAIFHNNKIGGHSFFKLPCQPGDQIWVRETFCNPNDDDYVVHKADIMPELWQKYKWKPSLHMKKDDCRLWLEVTDVRVERLHDITDEGAINEGIECRVIPNQDALSGETIIRDDYKDYRDKSGLLYDQFPVDSYATLWESINGKGSWDKNPFVWVIKFKIINK